MAKIIYRMMTGADLVGVRSLAAGTFAIGEPLFQNLKVDPETIGSVWVDGVFPCCEAGGVSAVAEDTGTGQIVGFRLTEISRKDIPNAICFSKDDPKSRKIALTYEVLHCLYDGLDLFSKYNVQGVAHFLGLAVAQSHQKRGIAKSLVEKSLELVREKGVKLVSAESTSIYSLKVFRKLGFEELVSVPYQKIVETGDILTMTEELEHHQMLTLCVKKYE